MPFSRGQDMSSKNNRKKSENSRGHSGKVFALATPRTPPSVDNSGRGRTYWIHVAYTQEAQRKDVTVKLAPFMPSLATCTPSPLGSRPTRAGSCWYHRRQQQCVVIWVLH